MNCTSCGASIENTSNKSSYQCEYCSSYNYDEKYIEERFANLNPTKANERITPIAAIISAMDAQSDNFCFIETPL